MTRRPPITLYTLTVIRDGIAKPIATFQEEEAAEQYGRELSAARPEGEDVFYTVLESRGFLIEEGATR